MSMYRTANFRIVEKDQKKVLSVLRKIFKKNRRTAQKKVTQLDPNYCYFVTSGLHGDVPNNNGDYFRWKDELLVVKPNGECRGMLTYTTWNSKPYHFNHDENYACGNVVDTWPIERDKSIDMLVRVSRKLEAKYCEDVESGKENMVSMGCVVGHSICSECNNVAYSEQEWCTHLQNHKGHRNVQGQMIYEDNRDIIGVELSGITIGEGADLFAKNKVVLASKNIQKGAKGTMAKKKKKTKKVANTKKRVVRGDVSRNSIGTSCRDSVSPTVGGSSAIGGADFQKEWERAESRKNGSNLILDADGVPESFKYDYEDPQEAIEAFDNGDIPKTAMLKVAENLRLVLGDQIDDLTPNQIIDIVRKAALEDEEVEEVIESTVKINDKRRSLATDEGEEYEEEEYEDDTEDTETSDAVSEGDIEEDIEEEVVEEDSKVDELKDKLPDLDTEQLERVQNIINEEKKSEEKDEEVENIKDELKSLSEEDLDKLDTAVEQVKEEKGGENGEEEITGQEGYEEENYSEENMVEDKEVIHPKDIHSEEEILEEAEEMMSDSGVVSNTYSIVSRNKKVKKVSNKQKTQIKKAHKPKRKVAASKKVTKVKRELVASFIKDAENLVDSYWVINSKKAPVFKVTAQQAFGDDVLENYETFTSEEYGKVLEEELETKGVEAVMVEWFKGGEAITDLRTEPLPQLQVGDIIELQEDYVDDITKIDKGDTGEILSTTDEAITAKWSNGLTRAVEASMVKKSELKEEKPKGDLRDEKALKTALDFVLDRKKVAQGEPMPPAPDAETTSLEGEGNANIDLEVGDVISEGEAEVAPFIDMLGDIMAPIIATNENWEADSIVEELKALFSDENTSREFEGKLIEKVKQSQEEASEERAEQQGIVDQEQFSVTNEVPTGTEDFSLKEEVRAKKLAALKVMESATKVREALNNKDNEINFLKASLEEETETSSELCKVSEELVGENDKLEKIAKNLTAERTMRMRAGRDKKLAVLMAQLGLIPSTEKDVNDKTVELLKFEDSKFLEKEKEVRGIASRVPIKRTASKKIQGMQGAFLDPQKDDAILAPEKDTKGKNVKALGGMWTPGNETSSRPNKPVEIKA